MKKYLYIFVISFILISLSQGYSQNFKAKDGLNTARNSAGISNPELLLTAAYNGTIQGFQTPLVFDVNSGESNVWFYLFRSADDYNVKKLMLCMNIINLVASEIPITTLIDSLPYEPAGSLNDIQWIDSDVMSNFLRNYTDYQNYKNLHADATVSLVTLSYNGDYPYIPIGSAYWLAKIDAANTTSLICAVNALNGEVICFDEPSAVDDNEIGNYNLSVYPNPAKDNLFIILPDGLSTFSNVLQIYNSEGKLAYNFNVKPVDGVNLISIPIKLFSAGHYIVSITTPKGVITGKFVID